MSSIIAGRKIEVIKTYDGKYAREAFARMDDTALDQLAASLDLPANFFEEDIPQRTDEDYAEFLWEAMSDSAREDGSVSSYFVVVDSDSAVTKELFVSLDWPTAEAYIKLISSTEHALDTH
ncbi:MAG TPA: hypothetical protein VHS13_11710 [Edaphobacter sp.]|jgi:hypothetical protein|nr:hypothetical protein [Edaphobacter sp.]